FPQLRAPLVKRRCLPDNLGRLAPDVGFLGENAFRPDRCQFGFRSARRMAIRGHKLERGITYWRAEEPAPFVRHLEEPACPPLSTDFDLGFGQVVHDRQCLIARSHSVPQLDAFVVRQEASPEPEVKEIARHVCSPLNSEPPYSKPCDFYFVPERSRTQAQLPVSRLSNKDARATGFSSNYERAIVGPVVRCGSIASH